MAEKFKILISDDMSSQAAEILGACEAVEVHVKGGISADDLKSIIGEYHGLLVRSRTKVTKEIIEAATNLKIIARAGIGVDNINIDVASRKGIVVENAPSGNSITTAEHAICLLLSLARHIPQATASMKQHKWEKKKFKGREIFGKTLGIVGLGNIGRIVSDRARGLKMTVIAYDPFIGSEAAERLGVELCTLSDLYKRADFITVHTPLLKETKGLIGREAFMQMKDGVLIVNAARGGIVDEDALLEALSSGRVGGAALDVFENEPPGASPLVSHPLVICTPHLGASTQEALDKVAVEVAEQLCLFAERGEVRNAINLQSPPPEHGEKLAPWQVLAGHLGSLVAQFRREVGSVGGIDELVVEVSGDPAELGSSAVASAALVGLLKNVTDIPVNQVNAHVIAKERGLSVLEVKRDKDVDLQSAITVRATAGESSHLVKGTLYHVGQRVEPRIIQIDEFFVELPTRGPLLAVLNQDQPGVIGAVGTLLGENKVNVHSLHVGLDREKQIALALWSVDEEISEEVVVSVRALELVESAHVLFL